MIVLNCKDTKLGRYIVARDCGKDGMWFYGSYDNLDEAERIAETLGNGIVAETKDVDFSCRGVKFKVGEE